MPYPPRPQLPPLPEFEGTALSRPDPAMQARVETFIVAAYGEGRSLRELAELRDRSHSAVHNILAKRGLFAGPAGPPLLTRRRVKLALPSPQGPPQPIS